VAFAPKLRNAQHGTTPTLAAGLTSSRVVQRVAGAEPLLYGVPATAPVRS